MKEITLLIGEAVDEQRQRRILGAAIRALRMGAGMTQAEMASRICVSPRTIIRWEAGESDPRKDLLKRIIGLEKKVDKE